MNETFTWIENIIDSCHNDFHFSCADTLITLFSVKYGNSEKALGLKMLREDKWNEIHTVLV